MGTALTEYSNTQTPKGILSGDEVPDDTTMRSREDIWAMARRAGFGESFEVKKEYAKNYWVDEQFGALIDHLKMKGIYDETLIILQSDHGMPAKGTLYEHGSRIFSFMRYPPLFGTTQTFVHEDLVVSNVDLAPTIFDLIGATVPEQYQMDGTSWLHAVQTSVDSDSLSYGGDMCCLYRFIEMYNSRSIVSADYQYIWRSNDELETDSGVTDYYANVYDEEQLYDLTADPNEQNNVIEDIAYEEVITEMRLLMREYIESTCPMEEGECSMPPEPEVVSSAHYAAHNPYDRGDGIFSAAGIVEALDVNDDGDDGSESDSNSDSTDSPSDSDSDDDGSDSYDVTADSDDDDSDDVDSVSVADSDDDTDSDDDGSDDTDSNDDDDDGVFSAAAHNPYSRGDGIFSAVSDLGKFDISTASASGSGSESDSRSGSQSKSESDSDSKEYPSKEPMKSKKEWPSPKPTRKPTSWTKKVKETPEPTKSWKKTKEPTKSRKKKTKEPTKSTKSWSKKEYPSPSFLNFQSQLISDACRHFR